MRTLAPINETLRSIFGTSTALPGLAPDLVVPDESGWLSATALAGALSGVLLGRAARHWNARPPAAAALAFKTYTYWVCLPAVLGYLSARRVPLLTAPNVLIRLDRPGRLVTVGLPADVPVAVRADDPLAGIDPATRAVPDDTRLLTAMRHTLLDGHLVPLLETFGGPARVGRRTLLGSVAANIAGLALRCPDRGRPATVEQAAHLLEALDIGGLVDFVTAEGRTVVRRRTCCLAFTLPRPKICLDCCVRPVAT
jgi:hypothetical protein